MCIDYFCIILSYKYLKIFFHKNSKLQNPASFPCFRLTGRPPGRPAPVSGRARLCTSVGRPARSTDCKQATLGLFRSTARSTALRKLCFLWGDGRPDSRPEPNGSLPARRRSTGPVDRQACCWPTALSSLGKSENLFFLSSLSEF